MVKQGITQFIDIGSGTAHRKQHARRRAAPGPRGQSRVRRHRRYRGAASVGERGRHPRVGAGAGGDSEAP